MNIKAYNFEVVSKTSSWIRLFEVISVQGRSKAYILKVLRHPPTNSVATIVLLLRTWGVMILMLC